MGALVHQQTTPITENVHPSKPSLLAGVFVFKEQLMADLPELEEIEENLKYADEDDAADVEGH